MLLSKSSANFIQKCQMNQPMMARYPVFLMLGFSICANLSIVELSFVLKLDSNISKADSHIRMLTLYE